MLLSVLGIPSYWERGRSQTQSSCQGKSFVQTELLLQPPSREAVEIEATAMKQGELPQGEAPVEYIILAQKQALT